MRFSIDRSSLLNALQKIQTVVEKKNTIQILGHILCVASPGELCLAATDLEIGIKIILPAEVSLEGKVTLSAKHFLDIVKELPEKRLSFSKKENHWVELTCDKARFNIVSMSADQYPTLATFEDKHYTAAKAEILTEMIDRTQFAVSTDTSRYHVNGVFFENLGNGLMRMSGTDGHRLSFIDCEVFVTPPELKKGVILPKKGLLELRKFLESVTGDVGLAFEQGFIFVKAQHSFLFIKLLEGEFPDYRHLIPQTTKAPLLLDRNEFFSALKRVSLLVSEKSKAIKFSIESNTLIISLSNPEMGEAFDEMSISYDQEPLEIGFNSKYLLECLTVMKGDQLEFTLKDRLAAGVLTETKNKNHTYVLMPMRIA